MKTELKIPRGWHKLKKGTRIKKGDKYWYSQFYIWENSINWQYPNKPEFYNQIVGRTDLTYIRKNK